jgi:hypothetical protein
MNAMLRPVLVGSVLGLLAVSLVGLRFACSRVDFQEVCRSEDLEQRQRATARRLEAMQQVVQELIAQRRTLAEAIARFQEVDHEWPEYTAKLQKRFGREWSGEEKAYRFILSTVQDLLRDRPEEAAAVIGRLEKEYQQLQAGKRTPSTVKTERIEPSR